MGDHLADPALLIETVRSMDDAVKRGLLPGHEHVMEETPIEQRAILRRQFVTTA